MTPGGYDPALHAEPEEFDPKASFLITPAALTKLEDPGTADTKTKSQMGWTKDRAKPRKIKLPLDEDDALLMDLHMKGMADTDIAEWFANERGQKYDPKSLVSRINRIIRHQQNHRDQQLEEELTEWHADEVRS